MLFNTKALSKFYIPESVRNGRNGCKRDDEACEARQQKVIGILFQESKVIVYNLELARNSRDGCRKDFQFRQDYRSKSLIIFPDFLN